MLLIINYNS